MSQELVDMSEVYIENDLIYKNVNNALFTGTAQMQRKNGHLVYEEVYKDGMILFSNLYFNGKIKRVAQKTLYNPKKLWVISKEIMYDLNGGIFEMITYNEEGEKILVEKFEKEALVYSCQYLRKKKHGLEISYGKNGKKITYRCEYTNGKKNGTEFCVSKEGVETTKEYVLGKRVH